MLNGEDMCTQAGLFSAVSSAFIIDVQSNLQPDPNEMTAAHLRILIHNMNNSLFPDADPSSATWTGPPPEIITVQSLLYGSLATSLFAAFIAMLGKQWVTRYLRKQGGSAVEKSRDRQRKLEGFKKWHFQLAIESLPVMLQLALLLLGYALTLYLWTISRTVSGVILAFTLLGITTYTFFTLVATLYYNCPYQTPASILIRTAVRHLAQNNSAFFRSLRALISYLPSTKDIRRLLGNILFGLRGLDCFHCSSAVEEGVEYMARVVVVSPTRIFEDNSVDLEVCEVESRCIWWVLDYTTDPDVISSTARFAADAIWYPEIVGVVSPHALADLFFDCLSNGQVIPGKFEHASAIGMALALVLSTHLILEPGSQVAAEVCLRIREGFLDNFQSDPTCLLVVRVLTTVAKPDAMDFSELGFIVGGDTQIDHHIVNHLSSAKKLWLSRVMLQNFWRQRRLTPSTSVLSLYPYLFLREGSIADGDNTPILLKTICFLAVAISLGLKVDSRDLCPPNTLCVPSSVLPVLCSLGCSEALKKAANLVCQQLQTMIRIRQGEALGNTGITWALSALVHLDPLTVTKNQEMVFSFVADILSSSFSEEDRYLMASNAVQLLENCFFPRENRGSGIEAISVEHTWIPLLLAFLSLSEKFYATQSPPYVGSIALRILSVVDKPTYFDTTIFPILSSTLLQTHPLQSRTLALKVFNASFPWLLSLQMGDVPVGNLKDLLQAVGDPFVFAEDTYLLDRKTRLLGPYYQAFGAAVILIGFASSNLWRNYLHPSNFTTCEEFLSTEEGKKTTIKHMLHAQFRLELLRTAAKVVAAIERLEELQCWNTAEVVIMWAWTVGVLDARDVGAWGLVGRSTHSFYQTRGMGRLKALERHITNGVPLLRHIFELSFQPRTRLARLTLPGSLDWDAQFLISQVCRLRSLYCLFGRDPTTQEDAAADEGAGKGMDLSLVVTPVVFVDWTCDYP